MRRYAIYTAPRRDEPLAAFAAAWLGRDPESGKACGEPFDGLSRQRLDAVTAEPRRYGFHGTLKPPFALWNASEGELLAAARAFAERHSMVTPPPLELRAIGRFLALCPSAPCPALDALAAACVEGFDEFRAPPSAAELDRRRVAKLSPRQEELLVRWGYPYVFEEFRFHLTLTGALEPAVRSEIEAVLSGLTAPYRAAPFAVRDLVVFRQDDADDSFNIIGRFALAGA